MIQASATGTSVSFAFTDTKLAGAECTVRVIAADGKRKDQPFQVAANGTCQGQVEVSDLKRPLRVVYLGVRGLTSEEAVVA
jgi:hypothetical protein